MVAIVPTVNESHNRQTKVALGELERQIAHHVKGSSVPYAQVGPQELNHEPRNTEAATRHLMARRSWIPWTSLFDKNIQIT